MARRPAQTRAPLPKPVKAQYDKCAQMIRRGNATAALLTLSQLRQARPQDTEGAMLAGEANASLGRHAESIDGYADALRLAPQSRDARVCYADALRRGGRYEESLEQFQRLHAEDPRSIQLTRSVGATLIDLGRDAEAAELMGPLLERRDLRRLSPSDQLYIAIVSARLAPKHLEAGPIIERLRTMAADEKCITHARVNGYNQLGRLLEGAGDADGAFDAFKAANEVDLHPWDADAHSARIDALIECWRGAADIPRADADGSRHVFVVGMMRSGTSLTEQMIAMGEGVTPGGELNAISRAVASVDAATTKFTRPMPVTRARYQGTAINRLRAHADKVYNRFPGAGLLTDKQPSNYLYIPLIARLYPGVKIVHCMRDARDCCLSNFTQAFNRPHPFTEDLTRLGRYYRDYERLMKAWHELGDAPILDVRYEELVADAEGQSRRIFDFLGLEWTQRVLEFHESDRTVATASRQQVRQPLYTTSVAKHEKYRAHLGPLNEALGISTQG
ncbi:MAG: hypothetical protein DHS20C14_03370 [Phycisphaeraceae bacterium]|nr:MAG: hypothetical protein DHS20C14_03370 [Phycisphaeraceae bacterium]